MKREGLRRWAGPVLASVAMISAAQAEEIVVIGAGPIGFKASSLNAEALDRIGAQAPSEALNRLAGVNVQRNNGLENLLAVRSPVLTGGQSAGSFLVLEDGVPIRAAGFANVNQVWETSLDFADRLDVVRGPGGAAYGANAVHGLIDVRTPAPGELFDGSQFDGSHWRFEAGGFGRAALTHIVDAGAPWLIGLHAETDAGWRAQSGLDRQALLVRRDDQWGPWAITASLAAQNLNQETAGFIEGANVFADQRLARSNPTPEAYRDTRLVRARLSAETDVSGWRVALTPFARFIEADLTLSFFPSRAQEITRQAGGGAQARWSKDGWTLGVDIDRTRATLREFQSRPTVGTFTQGLHYDYAVDMTQAAGFAETKVALADWTITAGMRAETIDYAYENRAPNGDVGRFRRTPDREDRFEAITPKLAAQRALWDGVAYAQIARGARAPQITDLYSLQTTQSPGRQGLETIDSVELGWRGQVWGADLDLAVYHMDKRGSSFRNADGFTVTDAATRHQGVEASISAPLTAWLQLSAWAAYARHTYRFNDPSTRLGEAIRAGDEIDTAPRWTGNGRMLFAPGADWDAELEWSHTGAYATNAANTRRYGGHDLLTLRGRARLSDRVWLSAAVRNLMDDDYAERADFAFGQDRYFPGEPRNLTIGLLIR